MRAAPRSAALLGIFAILLQAALFGWHHHPIVVPASGAPMLAAAIDAGPASSSPDEDHCDLCAALHHLGFAPGDFAATPPPEVVAAASPLAADFDPPGRSCRQGFCARAPPLGLTALD